MTANVGDEVEKVENDENATLNENLAENPSDEVDGVEKKGLKRPASPVLEDVKKLKVSDSDGSNADECDDEVEVIVLDDDDGKISGFNSPAKQGRPYSDASDSDACQRSAKGTPRTPKTPKTTKEERELLRLQKIEEKERQKAERERIAEEKRLEKEKEKEEKRLEKERKEREKLEKKLEEERKKEEKRREGEEKKRKEEEDRLKKKREEEEKKEAKRKEEEKRKKEDDERREALEEKKRRESARFLGFFSKVERRRAAMEAETDCWYKRFEMKPGMSLAPILMRDPVPAETYILDHDGEVTNRTYLTSDDVKKRQIVGSKKLQLRAKLIQFHDNRRPPYYGTWRKKAIGISGRRPTGIEKTVDYENDSDAEWEDEPSDGEECRSDEEEDVDDEAMSDDGFFVPPCYLSDGEGEDADSDGEKEQQQLATSSSTTTATPAVAAGMAEPTAAAAGDDGRDAEERRARLEARASEWTRRVSRRGPTCLVARCVGPCLGSTPGGAPEELAQMRAVLFFA